MYVNYSSQTFMHDICILLLCFLRDHYDSLANAVDMERYSSQMVLYHW